ncbi:MAG: insulinase family protein [Dehalococcoidia bacterium]|nr:MAG: insulinase family protein [Dehalococcoidia bacterium]
MYQKSVLENGLRIITSSMPYTYSVCIMIFIGAGSRYERAEEVGSSHFIEHLCFKGTERRATSKEISEAIEGVGGMLNGGTDKELTVYWCKVARPHFLLALDLMVDMLRNSRFDAQDMEKERQIIIEELNMSMDSPPQRVNILIDEVIWPNQPLGRDVAGSKETVAALRREMLLEYLSRQYVPNNTVVSVAGDIGHEEVKASLSSVFGDWTTGTPQPLFPAEESQDEPRLHIEHRNTEQAHLCLSLRGLSTFHPDRFNLDLLNVILGEGMSSRLFLEIRERRGLAYDIHSYVDHFLDSGAVTIYAGVDPKRIDATIEAILEELRRLKDGVPALELAKAKELAKGRLLLRMEDTRNVAGWMGGQELLTGRILTVDEVVSIIDAITAEDLERVARVLFITEKLNLAIVGPIAGGDRLGSLLQL